MPRSFGQRMCRWLALAWSTLTIVFLLVVSGLILNDSKFPLNLGAIKTVGRTGLWVTLLPGLVGLAGMFLLLRRVRPGAWLLGAYSLFWIEVLISGLPAVWNARRSFCFRTLCITTPWVGRSLVLALAGLWAFRETRRHRHRRVEESRQNAEGRQRKAGGGDGAI